MVFYKLFLVDTDGRVENSLEYRNLSIAEAVNRYRDWIYRGSHYYRGVMYRCTSSQPSWLLFIDDVSWY